MSEGIFAMRSVDGGPMQMTTRERLLHAAIDLFATRGYSRTSVGHIQSAAGLTAGSGALYKHYASKEELLDAVIDYYVSLIRDSMEDTSNYSGDPFADLEAAATALMTGLAENRNLVRVLFRELDEGSGLDRLWEAIDENVFQRFADIIRLGMRDMKLRDVDADAIATLLVSAIAYFPTVRDLIGKTAREYEGQHQLRLWNELARRMLQLE